MATQTITHCGTCADFYARYLKGEDVAVPWENHADYQRFVFDDNRCDNVYLQFGPEN